jgi:hypothetical protein
MNSTVDAGYVTGAGVVEASGYTMSSGIVDGGYQTSSGDRGYQTGSGDRSGYVTSGG